MSPDSPTSGQPAAERSLLRRAVVVERRLGALISLTLRESVRSRALLGMTLLFCLFAAGSLFWPADVDSERVVIVQRICFFALLLFGLIAAVFLGASSLPQDLTTKRIYDVATKPVTRFEILLGKTLGIIALLGLFLLMGFAVTLAVTHIASARKSYAGGSYTLEVTAPTAQVVTDGGPIAVQQGELLTAEEPVKGGYRVTLATQDVSRTGVIAADSVQVHERTLDVRRLTPPSGTFARCTGRAAIRQGELRLLCAEAAPGDRWTFALPEKAAPDPSKTTPVRIRVWMFQHEDPGIRQPGQREHVTLRFRNPASGAALERSIDLTVVPLEKQSETEDQPLRDCYEEIIALPGNLLTGGSLEMNIADCTPRFPQTGRVFYTADRLPVWTIRGFNPAHLPDGLQTLEFRFFVYFSRGMDLVDWADVTAHVRNAATGEEAAFPLHLRDRTASYVHFPRALVDERAGIEVSFTGIRASRRVGHMSTEAPVSLVLKPGSFWLSTARSTALILLNLSLFAVLAVAASTFLSAPVAILFTFTLALGRFVIDFMTQLSEVARFTMPAADPFTLVKTGAVGTLQDGVLQWLAYLFVKGFDAIAPDFSVFSSTEYVTRGWSVPWSAVQAGLFYAVPYALVCFLLGYAFLSRREFE